VTKKLSLFQTGVRRYFGLESLFLAMLQDKESVKNNDPLHLCQVFEGMVEGWQRLLKEAQDGK